MVQVWAWGRPTDRAGRSAVGLEVWWKEPHRRIPQLLEIMRGVAAPCLCLGQTAYCCVSPFGDYMLSSPCSNRTDCIRTDVYVYNLIKEIILKKSMMCLTAYMNLKRGKRSSKYTIRQCSDSEKQVKNSLITKADVSTSHESDFVYVAAYTRQTPRGHTQRSCQNSYYDCSMQWLQNSSLPILSFASMFQSVEQSLQDCVKREKSERALLGMYPYTKFRNYGDC